MRAKPANSATRPERIVALRTVGYLEDLQGTLRNWNRFYSGYDPAYTWWTADPRRRANTALTSSQKAIREAIIGQKRAPS